MQNVCVVCSNTETGKDSHLQSGHLPAFRAFVGTSPRWATGCCPAVQASRAAGATADPAWWPPPLTRTTLTAT